MKKTLLLSSAVMFGVVFLAANVNAHDNNTNFFTSVA
jgi:hypothetical protein